MLDVPKKTSLINSDFNKTKNPNQTEGKHLKCLDSYIFTLDATVFIFTYKCVKIEKS